MTEQRLKPISEVLRSPRFQKEVSLLLFFFAAVNAIFCVFLFAASNAEADVLVMEVATMVVQTIVYAVLAILIRRGSVKALVFTGFIFAANFVFTLFGPSWEDARGIILAYGLLIAVLIRFIRKERRAGTSENEA